MGLPFARLGPIRMNVPQGQHYYGGPLTSQNLDIFRDSLEFPANPCTCALVYDPGSAFPTYRGAGLVLSIIRAKVRTQTMSKLRGSIQCPSARCVRFTPLITQNRRATLASSCWLGFAVWVYPQDSKEGFYFIPSMFPFTGFISTHSSFFVLRSPLCKGRGLRWGQILSASRGWNLMPP